MILKNALVYIKDKGFKQEDILIKDNILCLEIESSDYNNYEIMDLKGKYITPGLIEAHSHIGICEEGLKWEGNDLCEMANPLCPELRGLDAINPFDIAFKEALSGGVTTVCTGPGSANVIAGTFSILKTYGNIVDEMIIKEYSAMKCAFGENPRECFGLASKEPYTRMGIAALLRKCLNDTIFYKEEKINAQKDNKPFKIDIGMEHMLKVINREVPLKAHAHRADDITTAIRIAKEFNVLMTLDHVTEGHFIADYIKDSGFPAIIGPSYGSRSKIECRNKTFETVAILNSKGVKVAITTDHNVYPQESLMMFAAFAYKAGLSENDAINAITSNPADILGLGERKGYIKNNYDADLAIWDKHPFDLQAKVEHVFIEGKKVL